MAQGIVGGMQTKVPMLDSIFRMEGIQATRSAFDEMSKISELDDDSWNAMMSMYANAGDTAEVIRLFEMRRKTAKKISMPIWKTSLAAMIKDGRPDEAIQILQNETGTTDVTLDAIQILIGPATKTRHFHSHCIADGFFHGEKRQTAHPRNPKPEFSKQKFST
eukprot:TRINITY_DN10860_c0_g1_i1.p1 TRINITY_DN10860_c0_g1~~TRINITY_DN10860_c0_g1_i1.p1  ORF type:complete len:163 (+),score=39.32 TRINITY_DN10860_c0_g1_i1:150-638(+)